MKINYFNHHKTSSSWQDILMIDGLPYNRYGISVTTNSITGQDNFATNFTNKKPGIDLEQEWGVGVNVGKKPQFTLTFKDVSGNSVTTGIFTVVGLNGGPLE